MKYCVVSWSGSKVIAMLIPHLNLICQSHMLETHHTNLQSVSLEGLFAKTSSVKELFLIHFLINFYFNLWIVYVFLCSERFIYCI